MEVSSNAYLRRVSLILGEGQLFVISSQRAAQYQKLDNGRTKMQGRHVMMCSGISGGAWAPLVAADSGKWARAPSPARNKDRARERGRNRAWAGSRRWPVFSQDFIELRCGGTPNKDAPILGSADHKLAIGAKGTRKKEFPFIKMGRRMVGGDMAGLNREEEGGQGGRQWNGRSRRE